MVVMVFSPHGVSRNPIHLLPIIHQKQEIFKLTDARTKCMIRYKRQCGVRVVTTPENGAALAGAIQGLQPGDRLESGPGRYTIARKFDVNLRGTEKSPIWIVEADP